MFYDNNNQENNKIIQPIFEKELSTYKNSVNKNFETVHKNLKNYDNLFFNGNNNEYKNVFVNSYPSTNPAHYIGCYIDDNNNHTMDIEDNGDFSFNYDTCKFRAIQKGAKYFSIQNTNDNGLSECYTSNDIEKSTNMGSSNETTVISAWSFGNGISGCYMTLQNNGDVLLYNSTDNTLLQKLSDYNTYYNTEFLNNCINDGTINVISSTYGINCNTNGYPSANTYNVQQNNVLDNLKTNANGKSSYLYSIGVDNNGNFIDPALGCEKDYDLSYQCGLGSEIKTLHIPHNEGTDMRQILLDCSSISGSCKCFMKIGDDGNIYIYGGNDTNNTSNVIFKTTIVNTQKVPNPNYIASKGKTGFNYLLSGTSLMSGEWIGNNDGSAYLQMQQDGILDLIYTVSIEPKCIIGKDNNYYGKFANAIYQLSDTIPSISGFFGKLGYINGDAILKEYPTNMITYTNNYTKFDNSLIQGNDISDTYGISYDECKANCDADINCKSFNISKDGNNYCLLKSTSVFDGQLISPNSNFELYSKNKSVDSSTNETNICNQVEIVDIETLRWNSYNNGGIMSSEDDCSPNLKKDINNIKQNRKQINKLASIMKQENSQLKEDNINMYHKINKNIMNNNNNLYEIQKINSTAQIINNDNYNAIVKDTNIYTNSLFYNYNLWFYVLIIIIFIAIFLIIKKMNTSITGGGNNYLLKR